MLQTFFLSSMLAIFFTITTFAADNFEKDRLVSRPDTADERVDTSIQALTTSPDPTDPKEGFKHLFVTTTRNSDGVRIEQLNPLAIEFVEDYIEKFGKKMETIKVSGRPYFDMMDVVLAKHGLPKELKYLAVIESFLKPNARSVAGAVGPWQFMPGTARKMGLQVGYKLDERRDLYKSTHAASRYLTSLYSLYGDWLLVIAAYNSGPGTVNNAIRRSGTRDFWKLQQYLPLESRNHVKKFIATHFIMEGQGGITTLTKMESANRVLTDTVKTVLPTTDARLQTVSGRYNSLIIIKHLGIEMTLFNQLNPEFDKVVGSTGNYPLRLPNDKMELFLVRKQDILYESMQLLLNPDAVPKTP
jgi:membrane-bound lytic murein transglycosylase D